MIRTRTAAVLVAGTAPLVAVAVAPVSLAELRDTITYFEGEIEEDFEWHGSPFLYGLGWAEVTCIDQAGCGGVVVRVEIWEGNYDEFIAGAQSLGHATVSTGGTTYDGRSRCTGDIFGVDVRCKAAYSGK